MYQCTADPRDQQVLISPAGRAAVALWGFQGGWQVSWGSLVCTGEKMLQPRTRVSSAVSSKALVESRPCCAPAQPQAPTRSEAARIALSCSREAAKDPSAPTDQHHAGVEHTERKMNREWDRVKFTVSLNWPRAHYSPVPSGLISVNFPK